jgi:phosphoserine/homoserine phosphotransferase
MDVICLDLEGVLVPEIWIAFARKTGIDALLRTTRDEPDYDRLMRYRLAVLQEHRLGLADIQAVIHTLDPLPGALEFVDWAKSQARFIVLSDTFAEFAGPLMAKLDYPTLFCHSLKVGKEGAIEDYCLRQPDQKRKAVEALRGLNFRVLAAGDSYNDLSMIDAADAGFLYCPPQRLIVERPDLPVAGDYSALRNLLAECML